MPMVQHEDKRWIPPREGWVKKVNVDGAFVQQTSAAAVGAIDWDSQGKVIFTAWRALFHCANAVEAEARACVEGGYSAGIATGACMRP